MCLQILNNVLIGQVIDQPFVSQFIFIGKAYEAIYQHCQIF